jgi:hypothetical protein
MVVYDISRRPEPEIPFPNNSATRIDPTSPTGRRLNLSEDSPIEPERILRKQFNRLDGFSVFGPITVSFDAPIDLSSVTDESVLLYDISPASPEYGRAIPLDLGRGAYPQSFKPRPMFPFDPFAHLPDLLFAEDNEVDGVRVEHYEVATNTLILRAMFPLRPATDYAVVLTRSLVGTDGQSIRSPFPGVNIAAQTQALQPVVDWVPGGGGAIAFAWTFTTQTVADHLVAIRKGLDGQGSLAWMRDIYPGRFLNFKDLGVDADGDGTYADEGLPLVPRDHRYILQPQFLVMMLKDVAPALGYGLDQLEFPHVDYMVFGAMESPELRAPDGGIWVNRLLGTVDTHSPAEVTFTLSVPKTTSAHQPPFPVIIYNHGARTSRFELMLIANSFAERGFAMMGIDAAGHGPFGGDLKEIIKQQAGDFPEEIVVQLLALVAKPILGEDYSVVGKTLDDVLADLGSNGLWQTIFAMGAPRIKMVMACFCLEMGISYPIRLTWRETRTKPSWTT